VARLRSSPAPNARRGLSRRQTAVVPRVRAEVLGVRSPPVAAIGMLPLPLLHRAVVVNMQRSGGSPLKRLDESDPAFAIARAGIQRWAARCILAQDPVMPAALRDRAADNWRVLLAIADNLAYGEPARRAAVTLSANRPDEDPGVTLLADIRIVFQARDRIASAALVEALTGLDDGRWNEWRGPKDDRPPRKLTQGELSHLLRPFGIVPKTIWPGRRRPDPRPPETAPALASKSSTAALLSPARAATTVAPFAARRWYRCRGW
jgi:hypothetical protein